MTDDGSTLSGIADHPRGPRTTWGVRLGLGLLAAVVLAAATGLLSTSTATTTASASGWLLEVEHAERTRSGMPAPLRVRVEHPGGLTDPVRLALCPEWFDHLDFQNWYPNPSAETREPGRIVYEFDLPPGDTFEVALDARTAPGALGGVDRCRVEVLLGEAVIVDASWTTVRLP